MLIVAICYFPELWAGDVEIGEWKYRPPQVQAGGLQGNNTDVARVHISPWDLPAVRFVQWMHLTVEQKSYALVLGYNAR